MISAGYQLHVTTWENDADSYKTKILDGLAKEEVEFYIELASKFKSKNDQRSRGLGNGGVPTAKLVEVVQEVVANHPHISDELRTRYLGDVGEDISDFIYELIIDDLLGFPENEYYHDEGNFCRVFDSFKVFYFPQAVEEVTKQFM